MSKEEDKEFKDMLKELRHKYSKPTMYELELINRNLMLEQELESAYNERSAIQEQLIRAIDDEITLKYNVESFAKREAITLMRLCKSVSKDKQLNEELQHYINKFIFKLNHCLFLSKKR